MNLEDKPISKAGTLPVPEIVPIVLQQAFRFHTLGRIDQKTFEEQLDRLQREELQPRGLALQMQPWKDGGATFVIHQSATGRLCASFQCARARMGQRVPVQS